MDDLIGIIVWSCVVSVSAGFLGFLIGICFDVGSNIKERCDDRQRYKERGVKEARDEAIEAGVGEYYLDENHDKQFRWKPGKEQRND